MAQRGLIDSPGSPAVNSDVIDACLHRLRRSLQWRSDVDDILAEMEDHLQEAVSRLVDRGMDPGDAAAMALASFGEPDSVARSFARTPSGGIAVPTRLTRRAGAVAHAAAGMWILAAMLTPLATDFVVPWQQSYYLVWSASVVLAALATTVAVSGLLVRSAAGLRWAGPSLGLLILGTGAFIVGTWLWQLGAGLLALGALLALARARAAGLRLSTLDWLVVGPPVGAVAQIVVDRLDGGVMNAALAGVLGFGIAAVANAAALVRLGWWLRSETPADLDDAQIAA
jgi:hypothetical protein